MRAPACDELRRLFPFGEMAGAFHSHVDALVRHFGRVLLRRHADRSPTATLVADGDAVGGRLHLAREAAMYTVVAEQVRISFDAAEVVDRHRHYILAPALDNGA